jgi:hypothetical protein
MRSIVLPVGPISQTSRFSIAPTIEEIDETGATGGGEN